MTLLTTKIKYATTGMALAAGMYALKKGMDKNKQDQNNTLPNFAHANTAQMHAGFPRRGHLSQILQTLASLNQGAMAQAPQHCPHADSYHFQHAQTTSLSPFFAGAAAFLEQIIALQSASSIANNNNQEQNYAAANQSPNHQAVSDTDIQNNNNGRANGIN